MSFAGFRTPPAEGAAPSIAPTMLGRRRNMRPAMIPNWAAPFGWVLFCIACDTLLAIVLLGCQMPLR